MLPHLLLLLMPVDRWVTDADLRQLARQAGMEQIDLSETKISNAGLMHLKGLTNVRSLHLHYAEFITEDGLVMVRNWTKLERLNLHGTRVTSKVFDTIAAVRSLRDLDLGHTEIIDDGFDQLAELPKLERLVIGGNRLTGDGLVFLREIASLRELDVSGTQRVDSGLWGLPLTERNLERIGALRQLRRLSLAAATLADRGVDRPGHPEAERSELRDLGALRGLENLEFLDLSRQPVSAETLKTIAMLPRLRELRLAMCRKIDDGAVEVLLRMPALRVVYAVGSGMSAAGMERLAGELGRRR